MKKDMQNRRFALNGLFYLYAKCLRAVAGNIDALADSLQLHGDCFGGAVASGAHQVALQVIEIDLAYAHEFVPFAVELDARNRSGQIDSLVAFRYHSVALSIAGNEVFDMGDALVLVVA